MTKNFYPILFLEQIDIFSWNDGEVFRAKKEIPSQIKTIKKKLKSRPM